MLFLLFTTTAIAGDKEDWIESLEYQVQQHDANRPVTEGLTPQSGVVFGLDLPTCIQAIENRNAGFQTFDNYLIKTQQDVINLQTVLMSVESNAKTVLDTETDFSTTLVDLAALLEGATERSAKLLAWETTEAAVRFQLRDLFSALEVEINADSASLQKSDKALRNSLNQMESTHDRAKQVLLQIADLEMNQYEWAHNVTSKINLHNLRIIAMAQEVQFRHDEVESNSMLTTQLEDLITESK